MFLVRKIGAWGYEEFHSRPEADVYANRTTECVMCDEHLGVERGVFLTVSLNLNSDDMYLQPVHFACTAASGMPSRSLKRRLGWPSTTPSPTRLQCCCNAQRRSCSADATSAPLHWR
jgi:hypothetical protein